MMSRNRCSHCNVYVEPQHDRCPLCSKALTGGGESITRYPDYQKIYVSKKQFTIHKLVLFLVISLISISILVNLFTLDSLHFYWSAIVSVSLLYSWVTYRNTAFSRMNMGGKILIQFVAMSVLFIVIDIFTGFSKWSTTYVMPFLSVALTLVLTLLAVTHKNRYKSYMGYLLAAFFISLGPVLLFLFNLSNHVWTSITAIGYSVLTMLGMMLLSTRQFKAEMKKRFHL